MPEEGDFKARLRKHLTKRGAFWSDVYQDGIHGKLGDPDIVVCYRGAYIGFEAKSATGSLRNMQKLRKEQLLAAGGIYVEARNLEQVDRVLDEVDRIMDELENILKEIKGRREE